MDSFPPAPVTPGEFIEEVVPSLFAEIDLDAAATEVDLKIGIQLGGAEGGEWTLHLIGGELGIANGLAAERGLTLLQSVEDWRSALWEGRPRLVSDVVEQVRRGSAAAGPSSGAPSNPDALRELEHLPGRIDAIIEGVDEPDWQLGIHLGSGEIPDSPNATIRIGASEAESIRRGELHPLEALISGQLRLEGDLGLILQLQAIAMAASLPAPPRTPTASPPQK